MKKDIFNTTETAYELIDNDLSQAYTALANAELTAIKLVDNEGVESYIKDEAMEIQEKVKALQDYTRDALRKLYAILNPEEEVEEDLDDEEPDDDLDDPDNV